nr:MAG TPA: Replication associated protein [Microviridae sp.]
MSCFHPLTAYRTRGGDVTFRQGLGVGLSFSLPCGQCIGCRLERSRQWAMRCLHESKLHQDNCFITLTYSDSFLPANGSLVKADFQRFIKRFRKRIAPCKIRFFHCGEYGGQFSRPHYHALIFGYDFPDKIIASQGDNPTYTSAILAKLWPLGDPFQQRVGALTFESAAYVARYAMKKITGQAAKAYYERVNVETGEIISLQPEYITMSLKPAIGKVFYQRFSSDFFPSDFCVVRGVKCRPPRYYDKLFGVDHPDVLERIKLKRIRFASRFKADFTSARLADREQVTAARVSQLKRKLEV